MKDRLSRVGRGLRDAWLIGGISLIAFLGLEAAYRGISALRRTASPRVAERTQEIPHPNSALPWWDEFTRGGSGERRRYDPYRLFWALEFHTRYVNVDSLGRRVTPQTAATEPSRRIVMLGGSTMWGVGVRDSFTIPAGVARRLGSDGPNSFTVENWAQPSFRTTQEAATLLAELARGPRPAAVVVLNGYNDAALALRLNRVGRANGEDVLRQRVALGRRGFWGELLGLGRHAALVQRLQRLLPTAGPGASGESGDICRANAEYYERIAGAMSGMGEGLGFPVWFFLQPMHFLTGKKLTPWEASLTAGAADAGDLRRCMEAIDAVMNGQREIRYQSLGAIFDADTASAFIDPHGHLTEAASDRVAECIAAVVLPTLAGRETGPGADPADRCRPRSAARAQ